MAAPKAAEEFVLKVGDHCQGQYRGDWYGAKVLEVAPDSVTVLWDPPHDKWGPLMLGRTMVKTDPPQTPEQEAAEERMTAWRAEQIADSSHPLLTLLPGALFDMQGSMVRTTKRLGGCGTIAILLVRLSDPRTDDLAGRCKAMCQALAARGSRSPLGVVVVPLDDALDGAMERGKWDAFCASAPADWLSIHYGNASYIVAETDLLRRCRVFSQEQLPSLCLFTASGRLINASASGSLASDPEAKGFPWASSTSTSWALALSVAAPVAAVAAYYLASRYFCWSRLTS